VVNNTIITNPAAMTVSIAKHAGVWVVTPSLTAFPAPIQADPKNIVFLLDNSASMQTRLQHVKTAVSNLLDKLAPIDTFSIVSFNSKATVLIANKRASASAIKVAKQEIGRLYVDGGTHFQNAFAAVNTPEILASESCSTIIFLTDGESKEECDTAKGIFKLFKDKRFLRIVPIGILDERSQFLDDLAVIAQGGERALYIQESATINASTEYQKAFDTAFNKSIAQSQKPAQLAMRIQAQDEKDATRLAVTRTLQHVVYDGSSNTATAVHFDAKLPPHRLQFEFSCESRILYAEHTLTQEEQNLLRSNNHLVITIPAFKWKNNSFYSWLISLANIVTGAALLAAATLFVLSFPQLTLALWQPLVLAAVTALNGAFLLLCGLLAVSRKTIFLPTKLATEIKKEENVQQNTQNSTSSTTRYGLGFFVRALAGSACMGAGATSGYYIGTLTFSSTTVMASGISPFVFMSGCAAAGAIALPILVYGCVKLGLQPLTESGSLSIHACP
jgi:hypothetical protein